MTITSHQICILLGSNIQPEYNLPRAIAQLGRRLPVSRISSVWETPAIGSPGPNFLNAAVLAYSQLHPYQLKEKVLRPLEAELGRIRSEDKNAARTIDLDVVVFDGHPIDHNLWKYAYAAVPVSELLPEIIQPASGASLQATARRLAQTTAVTLRSDLKLPLVFNQQAIKPARLLVPEPGYPLRNLGQR